MKAGLVAIGSALVKTVKVAFPMGYHKGQHSQLPPRKLELTAPWKYLKSPVMVQIPLEQRKQLNVRQKLHITNTYACVLHAFMHA